MPDTPSRDPRDRIQAILNDIKFQHWKFLVFKEPLCLRVSVESFDNRTSTPLNWMGRKWLLSQWMTDGEIVQTAWMAVQTAMEHEMREQFKYKGETIFDPHYDINALVDFRRQPGSILGREAHDH